MTAKTNCKAEVAAPADDTTKAAQTEAQIADDTTKAAQTEAQIADEVTVLVVRTTPADSPMPSLAARSVALNLKGISGTCELVEPQDGETAYEALLRHARQLTTLRAVVMTDRMVLLNPVTLGPIYTIKARHVATVDGVPVYDYDTGMPFVAFRPLLVQTLEHLVAELPHASLPEAYFSSLCPQVEPLVVASAPGDPGRWQREPWLLPLVSPRPDVARIGQMAASKRFLHIGPHSLTSEVEQWVKRWLDR